MSIITTTAVHDIFLESYNVASSTNYLHLSDILKIEHLFLLVLLYALQVWESVWFKE